jgi:ketosteroid isomerase-like protein
MMRTHDDLPRSRRPALFLGSVLLSHLIGAGCQANASGDAAQTIIAMERSALERWGKGDPSGYFEIIAPDTTYFDPTLAKRIDGVDALHALIDPFKGKIHIERAEMIDPKVQPQGDIAVLAFNLVSHGAQFGDGPKGDVRWNSTEVYQRISGRWKIIHSHWSYTKPELKEKPPE